MSNDTTTPSRRTVVGAMAAGTIATLGSPVGSAQAQTGAKTFVLVHGAWHGGWCWRRVSDQLEKPGHKVFAPTMTGLGERSHLLDPKVNLATHVTDIVNVIKWESLSNIVLVGHSYGGVIISGVAEQVPEAIGSIVYLDAFVPENGEALVTLTTRRQAIEDLVQKGETSMKPVPTAVFQVNEKDRAWVDGKCTPHRWRRSPTRSPSPAPATASPRRPIFAPPVMPTRRSTAHRRRSRRGRTGASTSCRAATTRWSICPTA